MSNISKVLISLATTLSIIAVVLVSRPVPVVAPSGSVIQGGEYRSTTTPFVSTLTTLCTGSATLGSIVITGQNVGNIAIYDATTSNINKRQASMASTTLRLAWLASNASSTTYTFDVAAYNGLLLDYASTPATSTITYRCNINE